LTGFFKPSNLPTFKPSHPFFRVLFKPMSAFWKNKRVIVTGGAGFLSPFASI